MTELEGRPIDTAAATDGRAIAPLQATLERPMAVGSNRRGRAGGGTLAYGLPDLRAARIACLGQPRPLVLETLGRLADDGTVTMLVDVAAGPEHLPLDVLWVSGAAGVAMLLGEDPSIAATIDGARSVVVDDAPPDELGAIEARLARPGRSAIVLATVTADGIVKTATPSLDDPPAAVAPAGPDPISRRVVGRGMRLVRRRHEPVIAAGRAVLAVPGDAGRPPAWLARHLEAAGVEPDRYTWRLASPGIYDSQKMLVHLEPADREAPALIAKVTRDERHNDRLATEASALPAVAALGSLGELIVPRLVGAGPVGRLWTAIETREAGRPLPGALRSNPDQAVVDRVVDGLTALSVASARDVPGVALATPLSALAERYRQTYVPSAAAGATLDRLLAPIARAARIPIVAQHGDPGSWNMLLAPDARIVVLDWESFEPDGPPLWDLWHLVRAITLDVDTSIVPRRHATRLVRTFLGTGRQNDQVVRATARYRQDVAVDDDLIVPLLVFGWLHRALKESTRMAPDRVGHGPTARFVAALLSSPDAPGLRRIMATGAAI